ncbi:MAG: 2-C-methyl-D-erythritol 4-phosphate cytidylyltransferase [Betaproteobacteria bacterium]|nr:MAG: 2-C-methyl-D-erythritol 4-phosphate cytidylyltransferase [Betaproteobacteria bacterium]
MRFGCVAIVPAGGSGARLGAAVPKQYLEIAGHLVLHHTLTALSAVSAIEHIYVAVQADDERAVSTCESFTRVTMLPTAGRLRAETVSNTLQAIHKKINRDAWILVHDAARPCVSQAAIDRLIQTCVAHPVGGLLALPVADTMKRSNASDEVVETLSRDQLWRAQTPQMFRFEMLQHALSAAPDATDESQAIEAIGLSPKLVLGEARNLKITYPEDIALASHFLQQTPST